MNLVYKLSNMLPTSLKIEDLGITLQAAGGKDSICEVSEDSFRRSSSIQEHIRRKWMSARPIHQGGPVSKPPVTAPVPGPYGVASTPIPPSDIAALHAEMRGVNARLDQVLTILRGGMPPITVVTQASEYPQEYTQSSTVVSRRVEMPSASQPMFIPGNIVPKEADVHISVSEEKSSGEGFDDALSALKKAKKKSG